MSETTPQPETRIETSTLAGFEIRVLGATGLELELRVGGKGAGELPRIVGYASIFDTPTVIGGGRDAFSEVVRPGAFSRAIAEDDVRALFNHNPDHVLGRTAAGTLKLIEDRHGLRMEIDPPDTQFGRDVVEMVKRRDINGASFGFVPVRQRWLAGAGDELPTRELQEVRLYDVSPVTYPAYPGTEVASRSAAWARRALLGEDLTEEEREAVRRLLHGKQGTRSGGTQAAEADDPLAQRRRIFEALQFEEPAAEQGAGERK